MVSRLCDRFIRPFCDMKYGHLGTPSPVKLLHHSVEQAAAAAVQEAEGEDEANDDDNASTAAMATVSKKGGKREKKKVQRFSFLFAVLWGHALVSLWLV